MEIVKFIDNAVSKIKSGTVNVNKDNRYCLRLVAHSLSSDPVATELLGYLANASSEFSAIKINEEGTAEKVSNIAKNLTKFTEEVTSRYITRDASAVSKEPAGLYYFPMPVSLIEQYHQNYETSKINLEQRMQQWGYNKAINRLKTVGNNIPVVGKTASGAADTIETLREFTSTLLKRSNVLIDPNILSVYKSSAPRTFSFTFDLVPRSQKEALQYLNSIEDLRLKTLATSKKIHIKENIAIPYLSQDYVFTFDVIDPFGSTDYSIISKLSKMLGGSRILTEGFNINSISITQGQGGTTLKYDGSPDKISVKIELEERKPLWKIDWENYINNTNTSNTTS